MTPSAIDQLTGRDLALEAFVRQVASNESLWSPLVRYTEPRLRLSLMDVPEMDVRLLTWAPGQGTGFHDHGGSAGAFVVVRGSIREDIVDDAGQLHHRTHRTGDIASFSRDVVHDMRNDSTEGTVTIHAYRPKLAGMRYYRHENGQVRPNDSLNASN